MITAIIILTLLSLLVATEPETTGTAVSPAPVPPLRPEQENISEKTAKSDRLAA